MKGIAKRLISMLVALVIMTMEFSALGSYLISYATEEENVEPDAEKVQLEIYYDNEASEITEDINTEGFIMYFKIKLLESGYLKDGCIYFSSVNFRIDNDYENEYIESIEESGLDSTEYYGYLQVINLKQINFGEDVILEIPVKPKKFPYVSLENFDRNNKILFSGEYMNSQGEKESIEMFTSTTVKFHGEAEIEGDSNLVKFVPYHYGNNYGVLLQYKLDTRLQNNNLPLDQTELIIPVPEINGMKPSNVDLMKKGKSTNKDDKIEYYSPLGSDWEYDEEEGVISYTDKNHPNKNSIVYWNLDSQDEYIVTLVYEGEEIYNCVLENGINVDLDFWVRITAYNDVETIREKWIRKNIQTQDVMGVLTDYSIVSDIDNLSKGYMYANYIAEDRIETEYNLKYVIDISMSNNIPYINIVQGNDKFFDKDENEYEYTVLNEDYIYIKEISIDKEIFRKILGENGVVTFKVDNAVGSITIPDLTLENNVVDLSNIGSNHISLATSHPINNGTLVINVKKAIKGTNIYNEETLKSFSEISNEINGRDGISNTTVNNSVGLNEPTSKAKITINPKQLSTVIENKNVEIRAILDTSNVNYSLYKNPTIKITFPKYFEEIKINSASLLFEEELEVKNMKLQKSGANKELLITLEGEQTQYNTGELLKGATISLLADIKLKTLTPSQKANIQMEVTNENIYIETNETDNFELVSTRTEVEYVAPKEVVAAASVSNYEDNASEVTSISSEKSEVTIKIGQPARTVSNKGTVINNYENSISDVVVLGRIPYKGNKRIDTNENLGTTFDMKLKSQIRVSGIENAKVYYSTNGEATISLTSTSNNWVENPSNLDNIKSYLIILEDAEINSGEMFEFTYNTEIPADLKYNNSAYGEYKVYFDNNEITGVHSDSKESSILGITTGKGADLRVQLKSNIGEGDKAREGQIIRFTAEIKNVGQIAAENVCLNIEAPEGTTIVYLDCGNRTFWSEGSTKTVEIGTIEPGQTIKVNYYLRILVGLNVPIDLSNTVTATANELDDVVSNTCIISVIKGYLAITLGANRDGSSPLRTGDQLGFNITVQNITNTTLNNVVFTTDLPDVFNIKKVIHRTSLLEDGSEDGVQINGNKITINLGSIGANESILINIDAFVDQIAKGGNVKVISEATATGIEKHYSNELVYSVGAADIEVSQISLTEESVKPEEEVKYKININKVGTGQISNIQISNVIPQEFEFVKATFSYDGKKYEIKDLSGDNLSINFTELTEDLIINVTLKAKKIVGDDEIMVETYTTVKYNDTQEKTSNTLQYYLETVSSAGEPISKPGTYKISGTAWLDENKNGQRDAEESVMEQMEVLLLYKDSNEIVVDEDLGTEKRVTTDKNGRYQFQSVKPGEYYVVFLYEAGKYDITTYNAQNVDAGVNCDAVAMETVIDGKNRHVGITNIIKVENKNIYNIDIGLFMAEKFDLSLEKTISKISLTTPTIGTKLYEYNDEKLAKIEVLSQNVGKSDIVIEYKIAIKNEGAIPGYAKKIVDYLPKGTKFNSELNKDWFLANDGNVYCYNLADTVINSGETKELTLILTCDITENVIGSILNNNAEIYEAYNYKGIRDVDSTPNDKVQTEDDMSNADVAISVATGKIITYTAFVVLIILMILSSAFMIKKFVLDTKE